MDIPFNNFRAERSQQLTHTLETQCVPVPAVEIIDNNLFTMRVKSNRLKNNRFDRINGQVRVVRVCFQGNQQSITTCNLFNELFNNRTDNITITSEVPTLDLFLPDNVSELNGLELPALNGSC